MGGRSSLRGGLWGWEKNLRARGSYECRNITKSRRGGWSSGKRKNPRRQMRSERVYEAHPYREQIGTNMEASELMITLSTISHARRTNDILLRIVSRAGETNPWVQTTFNPVTAFDHNSVLCGMDKGVVEKIFEATLLKTVSKWPRLLHGVQTLGFSACVETVETGGRWGSHHVLETFAAVTLSRSRTVRVSRLIQDPFDLGSETGLVTGTGGVRNVSRKRAGSLRRR